MSRTKLKCFVFYLKLCKSQLRSRKDQKRGSHRASTLAVITRAFSSNCLIIERRNI